jgi:hypothetical protein
LGALGPPVRISEAVLKTSWVAPFVRRFVTPGLRASKLETELTESRTAQSVAALESPISQTDPLPLEKSVQRPLE